MLNNTLLEMLVCPKCKGELGYQADEQDNRNGRLTCVICNLIFPIENEIAKLLIEEAKPLSQGNAGEDIKVSAGE